MENEELPDLKAVYDELWSDARTMVKDVNKSITTVFILGLTMLILAPVEFGTAVEMYAKITSGPARWLDYIYMFGGAVGTVVSAVCGVAMIRWHNTLKGRYANLIELVKNLGE